jgi:hypothetical protein
MMKVPLFPFLSKSVGKRKVIFAPVIKKKERYDKRLQREGAFLYQGGALPKWKHTLYIIMMGHILCLWRGGRVQYYNTSIGHHHQHAFFDIICIEYMY